MSSKICEICLIFFDGFFSHEGYCRMTFCRFASIFESPCIWKQSVWFPAPKPRHLQRRSSCGLSWRCDHWRIPLDPQWLFPTENTLEAVPCRFLSCNASWDLIQNASWWVEDLFWALLSILSLEDGTSRHRQLASSVKGVSKEPSIGLKTS